MLWKCSKYKLPADNQRVIGWDSKTKEANVLIFNELDESWENNYTTYSSDRITYWMPFPESPEEKIIPIDIERVEAFDEISSLIYDGFCSTAKMITKLDNKIYERLEKNHDDEDLQKQYDYISRLREKSDEIFLPLKYGAVHHIFREDELDSDRSDTFKKMVEVLRANRGKQMCSKQDEQLNGELVAIGEDLSDYFYILKRGENMLWVCCLDGIEPCK